VDDAEKDRLRPFARNMLAAFIAHRMGIAFQTAKRNYLKPDEEPSLEWFYLAQGTERTMLAHIETLLDAEESTSMSLRPN
jgi:hypothetical protein